MGQIENQGISTIDLTEDSVRNDRYSRLKESSIMLVDDEPIMLEIVQALLEEEGYRHFISLDNPSVALSAIKEKNPDIILLDLDMPELDGFQVLELIREVDAYKFLPVIILTASSDSKSKLRALELGATDFLSKPVDPSELALRVRNTLSAKVFQDQLTFYDSLTGLPNRKLFLDLLSWQIGVAKREDKILSLLNIGLDNFHQINETFGLSIGDAVLKAIVNRILKVIRSTDVVARSGDIPNLENIARINGDEFVVMLCGIENIDNASFVASRILEAVKKPIHYNEHELYLTASVGVASYPSDAEDVETLIKNTSTAKDFSSQQGGDGFHFYSSEMNENTRQLLKLESDLRKALITEQFELYYQPKVDAMTGKIVGMESLMRWQHPTNGMVSPIVFIPVAEKMGLIVPIGEWALKEACRQAREWFVDDLNDLTVSVNVSAKQFADPGFKSSVMHALESSGLAPRNLVLEITESMLIGNIEKLTETLMEIKALGVSFSLDDFGTGYSSLSYLKKFPIDELKIDRSFIIEIPENKDDSAIVRAIIAMAYTLGQKVVAEGVEELDQLEFLKKHNCNVIQGYYFSKPLNQADFTEYLQRN